MVVIGALPTADTGKLHDRIAWLSMSTVQAPHWAMPQANFVPVSFNESRSTHSNGVSGSTSTVCMIPLTTSVMAIAASLVANEPDVARKGGPHPVAPTQSKT